ncbi:MAG TPA: hypothetical protein VJ787_10805 [Thermoleophilia bacterium]|nr:hypothetical protein [Thermoleophilia bacterium]
MRFFSKPDIEKMRREGDVAGLVHWADFRKDMEVSRAAVAGLRENANAAVEYLYETAARADKRRGASRRKLLPRDTYLLKEAVAALRRVGPPAVAPLADSVRVYDSYGTDEGHVRFLYFALVFDLLEKIGRPAASELRDLAASKDPDVRTSAREALEKLKWRGQLGDGDE